MQTLTHEPCQSCGEPCRVPPLSVPFAIDTVFCGPECRAKAEAARTEKVRTDHG